MAQHRPSKPAPVEYSTDEEDMIVYDVDEDAIESNPDYQRWSVQWHGLTRSFVLRRQNVDAMMWVDCSGPGEVNPTTDA
ncbi:hypothetical protein TNCV_1824461 [Trichonephila clavipes]|nr:hypothetical protein TNCV_1824461 [Trichonephila clavipes]